METQQSSDIIIYYLTDIINKINFIETVNSEDYRKFKMQINFCVDNNVVNNINNPLVFKEWMERLVMNVRILNDTAQRYSLGQLAPSFKQNFERELGRHINVDELHNTMSVLDYIRRNIHSTNTVPDEIQSTDERNAKKTRYG